MATKGKVMANKAFVSSWALSTDDNTQAYWLPLVVILTPTGVKTFYSDSTLSFVYVPNSGIL